MPRIRAKILAARAWIEAYGHSLERAAGYGAEAVQLADRHRIPVVRAALAVSAWARLLQAGTPPKCSHGAWRSVRATCTRIPARRGYRRRWAADGLVTSSRRESSWRQRPRPSPRPARRRRCWRSSVRSPRSSGGLETGRLPRGTSERPRISRTTSASHHPERRSGRTSMRCSPRARAVSRRVSRSLAEGRGRGIGGRPLLRGPQSRRDRVRAARRRRRARSRRPLRTSPDAP